MPENPWTLESSVDDSWDSLKYHLDNEGEISDAMLGITRGE